MALSPREEDALATLEQALRADDPELDAALTRHAVPAASAFTARHVAALCGVLLTLVVAVTAFRPDPLGTAVLTAGLVGWWLAVTYRSALHPPLRSPGRRRRALSRVLPPRVGTGYLAGAAVVVLVALSVLPPVGQAVVGLVVLLVGVPWLGLRVLMWTDRDGRGTSR